MFATTLPLFPRPPCCAKDANLIHHQKLAMVPYLLMYSSWNFCGVMSCAHILSTCTAGCLDGKARLLSQKTARRKFSTTRKPFNQHSADADNGIPTSPDSEEPVKTSKFLPAISPRAKDPVAWSPAVHHCRWPSGSSRQTLSLGEGEERGEGRGERKRGEREWNPGCLRGSSQETF